MRFLIYVLSFALILTFSAQSKDWSDDQKAVWSVIENTAEAFQEEDWDKVKSYLSDDMLIWRPGAPNPSNKESYLNWVSFYYQYRKILKYEFFPIEIVIHGDTAVAHYFYESVEELKDGEHEQDNGHYTEVFVRDGKTWKFFVF